MPDFASLPAVVLGARTVSLAECLRRLHQRGRLLPLLRAAGTEMLLCDHARAAGLAVSDQELQQAADRFRQRHGLASAEATHRWLAEQCLSVANFEAGLERDLLIEQFKDHLTRDRVADHFAAHAEDYAQIRLRQIVVAHEDLARELLSQVQEEGRDFAELARTHSLHPSRTDGGLLGLVTRTQLAPAAAEAVFAARAGDMVGPLATPHGFHLFLVEERIPAQLDDRTAAIIRQELFDAWLNEQLKDASLRFPLLDAL